MSTTNHPNFHAVNFCTAVIASMYESLRGGADTMTVTDEMHNEIVDFVEHMENLIDQAVASELPPGVTERKG